MYRLEEELARVRRVVESMKKEKRSATPRRRPPRWGRTRSRPRTPRPRLRDTPSSSASASSPSSSKGVRRREGRTDTLHAANRSDVRQRRAVNAALRRARAALLERAERVDALVPALRAAEPKPGRKLTRLPARRAQGARRLARRGARARVRPCSDGVVSLRADGPARAAPRAL